VCIAVVGETPYAEGVGDRADLALSVNDVRMLERLRARCDQLVVVLISGRPLIVTEQIDYWDALVAAWLPARKDRAWPTACSAPALLRQAVLHLAACNGSIPLSNSTADGGAPLFPLATVWNDKGGEMVYWRKDSPFIFRS
jgi:hypothetical protein